MQRRALIVGAAAGVVAAGAGGYVWYARRPAPTPEVAAPPPAVESSPVEPAPVERSAVARPDLTDFDRTRGDPEAPNIIIEYASFTCGHCANFHNTKMAQVQQELVDTGRVYWVFRDFPLDGLALRAGMLARCVPENQFFPFVGQLFATQNQWARSNDPLDALSRMAQMAGMSRDRVTACMADEELANRVIQLRVEGEERYNVNSTPTFIVNGTVVSGDVPVADLERHLV